MGHQWALSVHLNGQWCPARAASLGGQLAKEFLSCPLVLAILRALQKDTGCFLPVGGLGPLEGS